MKNRAKLVLAFAAIVLAVLAVLVLFERVRGKRAADSIVAETLATGAVLDTALLAPAQPAENAAPDLLAAAENLPNMRETPPLMQTASPGTVLRVLAMNSWTNTHEFSSQRGEIMNWPALAERVAEVQDELTKVHASLRKEAFWSGFDYGQGFHNFETPGLKLLNLSRWLSAEALVHAKAGRTNDCFQALESLTLCVPLLSNERLIIMQLLRRGIAGQAFGVLWQTMAEEFWNDEQLARLQEIWSRNEFRRDMLAALEMERAMTIDHWRLMRGSRDLRNKAVEMSALMEEYAPAGQIKLNSAWVKWVALPMWQAAWSHHDEFNSLRIWNARVRHAQAAANSSWAGIKDRPEETGAWEFSENNALGFYDQSRFLFSARTIFSSSATLRNVFEIATARQLIIAAIGMERHRQRRGHVPKDPRDLADFGVADPVDPMDGTPLKVLANPSGEPTLYSAGYNGTDDAGDPTREFQDVPGIWQGKDVLWPKASE